MGVKMTNDCVCCADGCHHCGLDKDYEVRFCDVCGQEADSYCDEYIYQYDGNDYCAACLLEQLQKDGIITKLEVEE